jgi:hypothetical protein
MDCRSGVLRCAARSCARTMPRDSTISLPRSPRRPPTGAHDVVPVLFRRELDVQQRFFAMGEALAHLNHLWHTGRLARTLCADGRIRFALCAA